MISYFDHLSALAEAHGVRLLDAFMRAGVASSVYYRARQGSDLTYANALRVHDLIIEIVEQGHAATSQTQEAHELADDHA